MFENMIKVPIPRPTISDRGVKLCADVAGAILSPLLLLISMLVSIFVVVLSSLAAVVAIVR